MTTKTAGIPRYRLYTGPALFQQGFRPFFFGAGVWAVAAILFWLFEIGGYFSLPTSFDPIAWHVHEMIFGFIIAAIAGFLLTAIPNWTGRMPLQGLPLLGLFAVWCSGRIAVSSSEIIGSFAAAVLDLSFLALLLIVVLREIIAGRNWRNLPMPIALAILLTANALMHLDAAGLATTGDYGYRLAIGVVLLLISLVGGRIIPSFTRNWLKMHKIKELPAVFGKFDHISLVVLLVALLGWVMRPDNQVVGLLLILAAVTTVVRLGRWCGHKTVREPLLWSLHLGFAWVPIGLLLVGLSTYTAEIPPDAGIHALTAGAIGSMILAVMTRANLGHTGRPLRANWLTTPLFLCVFVAALLRSTAPMAGNAYGDILFVAGILWTGAFGIFVAQYGRILLRE